MGTMRSKAGGKCLLCVFCSGRMGSRLAARCLASVGGWSWCTLALLRHFFIASFSFLLDKDS